MNVQEAAAALDGGEYRQEGSRELFAAMKAAGLVAVFGASDDLVEFRGAIDDEQGACDQSTHTLTAAGLLTSECDCDNCPYFAKISDAAPFVEARWDDDGFSWTYRLTRGDGSSAPHEKFVINEDGEPYCQGVVFALEDLA